MTRTMPIKPNWQKYLAPASFEGVDRKESVLRGYVVAQLGPFKSEGRGEFDKAALETIVRLGNAKPTGLKSHFTHANASNDGLGNFLGRARKLRMSTAVDDRTGRSVPAVRADLHFDATALDTPPKGGKPLGVYVMDLAESDPGAISSSLVLKADDEYRRNKDGTLATDNEGRELPPLWRPTEIHGSDIVSVGDAVDSLLSAGVDVDGMPLGAVFHAEHLLSSVFEGQPREVIEARLSAYLKRYLDSRFGAADLAPQPSVTLPLPDADSEDRRLRLGQMRFKTHQLSQKKH